jgi:hypothetical protein
MPFFILLLLSAALTMNLMSMFKSLENKRMRKQSSMDANHRSTLLFLKHWFWASPMTKKEATILKLETAVEVAES